MSRFIDLTLTLENGTRALDLDPITFVNKYRTIKQDGYNLCQVVVSSHVGTHIDAPSHFIEGGETLDQVPLERLIRRGKLLDFTIKGKNSSISRAEMEEHDSVIEPGDAVLVRTDWYKTFPSRDYGYNIPNISTEAVKYLVEKKIGILGVEPPTLNWEDNPNSHRILLGGGVLLVEGLAYLDKIGPGEFRFHAIPLKIDGIDGFPVRAFAEIP